MAQKIAGESGIPVGEIKSTNVVHEFFQQVQRDRLGVPVAAGDDARLRGRGRRRQAQLPWPGQRLQAALATEVRWGDTLQTFRPRMSGIQQVNEVEVRAWDQKTKKVVNGRASSPQTTSQPRRHAQQGRGRPRRRQDRRDRPSLAATTAEANEIAKATLQRMADAFFESTASRAEPGDQVRTPSSRSPASAPSSAASSPSPRAHSYHGHRGYQTSFHDLRPQRLGRSPS